MVYEWMWIQGILVHLEVYKLASESCASLKSSVVIMHIMYSGMRRRFPEILI